jgi:hypothetical protein
LARLIGVRDLDPLVGVGEREESVDVWRAAHDAEAPAAAVGAFGGGDDDGETAAVHEAQAAQVDGDELGAVLRGSQCLVEFGAVAMSSSPESANRIVPSSLS